MAAFVSFPRTRMCEHAGVQAAAFRDGPDGDKALSSRVIPRPRASRASFEGLGEGELPCA